MKITLLKVSVSDVVSTSWGYKNMMNGLYSDGIVSLCQQIQNPHQAFLMWDGKSIAWHYPSNSVL